MKYNKQWISCCFCEHFSENPLNKGWNYGTCTKFNKSQNRAEVKDCKELIPDKLAIKKYIDENYFDDDDD